MPDVNDTGAEAQEGGDPLEQAMKDAVEAVEKVAGKDDDDDGDETEIEIEAGSSEASSAPSPRKKDANSAVTEALIKAKGELEDVLEQTQKEAKSLREKWLRSAADLQNYKKRANRERDEVAKFANERLLKDFLPVVDDMDRTLEVMRSSGDEATVESLIDGIGMVHKKFLNQLEKHGVTTFESVGKAFDPTMHEAVQQVESEEVGAGGVAAEMRRGFFLNERLLRPAMVTVSLGAPGGESAEAPTEDAPSGEAEESEAPEDASGE